MTPYLLALTLKSSTVMPMATENSPNQNNSVWVSRYMPSPIKATPLRGVTISTLLNIKGV